MVTVNPATLLYDRLAKWASTPATESAAHLRSADGDWVRPHLEAIEWALQVWTHLKSVNGDDEDDDAFMGFILRAIFTDHGLETSGQPQRHISDADLRTLRQIGSHWRVPLDVRRSVLDDISSVADDAIALVSRTDSLSDVERHYLLDVAEHLKKALLDIDVFGEADVHRLANELAGALVIYLGEAGGEAREAGDIVKRLVLAVKHNLTTATVAVMTGIATGAGEQAVAALVQ